MLNKGAFICFCSTFLFLTSCLKEIDGPIDVSLSPYPKVELNLELVNNYKAKIYYNLESKSIVKTADNSKWHIAFNNSVFNPNKVIMNYALGVATWGGTKSDTVWSRILTQSQLSQEVPIYANHYDSFANLFQSGLNNVYYLNFGSNLVSKKFQVLSYSNTQVTFRYANLDGSNEVSKTVILNSNTNYTYVSLLDGSIQDIEPMDKQSWDLEVTRYTTYVTDFNPAQMYAVGGFLSNPGKTVQVAKLENVNLADVIETSIPNFTYSEKIGAIGYDWKKFSSPNNDGFYVIPLRTYIVKVNGNTYGLQFTSYTKTVDSKLVNGYPEFLQRKF